MNITRLWPKILERYVQIYLMYQDRNILENKVVGVQTRFKKLRWCNYDLFQVKVNWWQPPEKM